MLKRKVSAGLAVAVFTVAALAGGAAAHQQVSGQWKWWTHWSPAFSACAKTQIHYPGTLPSDGTSFQWVVSGTDCNSTKQAAWQSATASMSVRDNGTWYLCGLAGAPPRQWTTLFRNYGENFGYSSHCATPDAWRACGTFEAEIWFTVNDTFSLYPLCIDHEGNS